MSSRAVKFAAGAAALGVAAARLCVADVSIDSWRDADATDAMQCPEHIARVAAEATAPANGARAVYAEFIDGRGRDGDVATLDLDAEGGGQPRPAFRLRFPPLRQDTQFMLALFMNDGSSRSACVVRLSAREAEFAVEFPLAGFRQALGLADYSDVDYILLVSRQAGRLTDHSPSHPRIVSIAVTGRHEAGALVARCR
jgi:hypothetical protein